MKKVAAFLVVILMSIFLSSCYDLRELEEMSYVIGIGLDKGNTNALRMTLQFVLPAKSSSGEEGGKGGGGGGDSKSTSTTVIETATIYAGLNIINTYISKQVNFSHAKIVVFSEELAREGVEKYIHAMKRSREFRGNMHVAVAYGCAAEEYLNNIKPTLELNISKYYEMNQESYKYTGFVADSRLEKFHLFAECTCRQAFATLVGLSKYEKSDQFAVENSTYREKNREVPAEGDFYAGQIPKVYDVRSEIMGLAVFNGDKMVGVLDGEETMLQQMLYGNFHSSNISIPDPEGEGKYILLNIKQSRKPVHKTTIENGVPKIYAKVRLEADIMSIQSGKNYESAENLPLLESIVQEYLKGNMMKMLEKTKEINSDICGFGRALKMKYLLWDNWLKVKWLDIYKDAEFDIEVECNIRRPGLLVRSVTFKGNEGGK